MHRILLLCAILFSCSVLSAYSEDFDYSTLVADKTPAILRQGIAADVPTQRTAVEMHIQGWQYTMPTPKSKQAAWGNSDGRTTWFYGYWHNEKSDQYSETIPAKDKQGVYVGDAQNHKGFYRRGGSPPEPDKVEWLLSTTGGPVKVDPPPATKPAPQAKAP